jgi:cobalt/nickel transport system permease protein
LFVRSFERGERVHLAMVSRGYDGRLPAPHRLATVEVGVTTWVAALALPAIAATVTAIAWLAR